MSEESRNKRDRSGSAYIKLVAGIAVFAVLMAVRPEIEQDWLRAVVAAFAGGVLAWVLLSTIRRRA